MFKKIICCVGICIGIFLFIQGISIANTTPRTYSIDNDYILNYLTFETFPDGTFNSDFNTYMYQTNKAIYEQLCINYKLIGNTYELIGKHTNSIIRQTADVSCAIGWGIISLGLFTICFFIYKLSSCSTKSSDYVYLAPGSLERIVYAVTNASNQQSSSQQPKQQPEQQQFVPQPSERQRSETLENALPESDDRLSDKQLYYMLSVQLITQSEFDIIKSHKAFSYQYATEIRNKLEVLNEQHAKNLIDQETFVNRRNTIINQSQETNPPQQDELLKSDEQLFYLLSAQLITQDEFDAIKKYKKNYSYQCAVEIRNKIENLNAQYAKCEIDQQAYINKRNAIIYGE